MDRAPPFDLSQNAACRTRVGFQTARVIPPKISTCAFTGSGRRTLATPPRAFHCRIGVMRYGGPPVLLTAKLHRPTRIEFLPTRSQGNSAQMNGARSPRLKRKFSLGYARAAGRPGFVTSSRAYPGRFRLFVPAHSILRGHHSSQDVPQVFQSFEVEHWW